MSNFESQLRIVEKIIPARQAREGAGFLVHRPFPTGAIDHIDPFLLLDEMGPEELGPGEALGAPDHPHRGFETVTYMLSGGMQHRDSAGNAGLIGPGDVQWMTAGSGVVHSELPSQEVMAKGGRQHGIQLWVNLPAEHKMMAPRYQEISREKIPVGTADGVSITVIAGEALGVNAAIDTISPIGYYHLRMEAGAVHEQPIPRGHNAFAYVLGGILGDAGSHSLTLFGEGDWVRLEAGSEGAELLLLHGEPIDEPVVRYGPFVMTSEGEIRQALLDYREGRMGTIA